MTEEWTPQWRLERAREREHIVSAFARGQSEWREVLDAIEQAESAEAAQEALQTRLGFSREQAMAVMAIQFRRVSQHDRTRVADELAALRAEIAGLEAGL